MTLSVDDQVTLVELGVILLGIVITWAIYRRPEVPVDPPETGTEGADSNPGNESAKSRGVEST